MKRFVSIVKFCAWFDLAVVVAWFVTLAINPVQASHAAFAFLAILAALVVGALLSAPLWLPLSVLILALATGNTIVGFVSNHVPEAVSKFKHKLFGSA